MTPAVLAELVRSVATDVLTGRGLDVGILPDEVTVQRPGNPEHGDYATNLALLTAPRTDVAARELAGWFADALAGADGIGDVQVAGPGFLNVRLTPAETLRDVLATRLEGAEGLREPADEVVATHGPVHVEDPGFARHARLRCGGQAVDLEFWSRRTTANPAFLVQYAHARAVALVRSAADLGVPTANADPARLTDPREFALIAELGDMQRVVDEALRRREPHRVVRQLERIAEAFLAIPDVLPAGDTEAGPVHRARLLLCVATRQVLADAAAVLGLTIPEQV